MKTGAYLEINDLLPHDVWLLFLHGLSTPTKEDLAFGSPAVCPTGLFGGALHELRTLESHRSDKWGSGGMVYWGIDSLHSIASLSEVMRAQ